MKFNNISILLLTVTLLNGCSSSINTKPSTCIIDPNNLNITGKIGIRVQDRFNSGEFQISFLKGFFEMTITGPLGFGSKVIKEESSGLVVDGEHKTMNFNDWMLNKYGWYFPVSKLPSVFLNDQKKIEKSFKDWDFKSLKKQNPCNYPKLIKFTHKYKDVQLKLAFDKSIRSSDKHYINNFISKIRGKLDYQDAKDDWGCDVHILQDSNGKVESVHLQSCSIDDNTKSKPFKDAIEKAIYDSSPLPTPSSKNIVDREIIFYFRVKQ
jgi:hypothetical protein